MRGKAFSRKSLYLASAATPTTIISAGLLLATRGFGTFVAMMMVGRLMRHIEARILIIGGLSLTAGYNPIKVFQFKKAEGDTWIMEPAKRAP